MKHVFNLPDGKVLNIDTPLARTEGAIKRLPDTFHVPFAGSSVKMVLTKQGPPHIYDPATQDEQPVHLRKK